jgi:predicted ATP-grasp superfamily ATP-dependent carboligase
MRVLLYEHLSAGEFAQEPSLLREGAAMLRAAREDLEALPGVEVVVAPTHQAVAVLAQQCDAALLIAPEFDDILAQLAASIETIATCRLLGPLSQTIRLTADKLRLAEHWQASGVPTPATTLLNHSVIKPRFGAGCQTTLLTCNDFVLQEHVPGIPVSVAFIGEQPLRACTQTIVEVGGLLTYQGGRAPLDAALEPRAIALARRAVAAVAGLQGYYGVDLVLSDAPQRDVAIEINPRLTTSYIGLRELCEQNLMGMLLGHDCTPLRWKSAPVFFSSDGSVTRQGER